MGILFFFFLITTIFTPYKNSDSDNSLYAKGGLIHKNSNSYTNEENNPQITLITQI